jgi:uncharacterized protein
MAKDPVCGMQVDEQGSPSSSYQGKTYYFCGQSCKDEFDEDPARFIGKESTQSQSGKAGGSKQRQASRV